MDTEYHILRNAGGPSLHVREEVQAERTPPMTPPKPKKLSNGRSRIVAGGLAVMIPMIVLPFLLLSLVLARATKNSPSTATIFSFNATNVPNPRNAYYVDMNATTLLTISAWSSTLTPVLGVLLMELWSYHTASSIRKHSRSSGKTALPTPYQFALLLETLKGNVGSLLSTWNYGYFWTRRRTATVPLLRASVSMLSVVTFLGLLILLADTWLHLETETVTISKSLDLGANITGSKIEAFMLGLDSDESYQAVIFRDGILDQYQGIVEEGNPNFLGGYGTEVQSGCDNMSGSRIPCSMMDDYDQAPDAVLNGQDTVTGFLANSSTWFRPQILPFNNGSDNGNLTFIAPAKIWQPSTVSLDYIAKTYGAVTTCKPMTQECGLQTDAGVWSFDCKNNGSTYKRSWAWKEVTPPFENHTIYFDQQYSKPYWWIAVVEDAIRDGAVVVAPTLEVGNPSYPAAVIITRNQFPLDVLDKQTATFDDGRCGMALFCKHTIMDVNYSFINGTFAIIDASPSNIATANITNIPIAVGYLQSFFNESVDNIMSQSSSQMRADAYATTYNLASMAILSGTLETRPVREAQIRREVLVTRVPKAPLFVLIVLNILYAAIGLALTLVALRAVRKDEDLVDVQARLSIAGLAAECFEDEDDVGRKVDSSGDLFGEKTGALGRKIGVGQAINASPSVGETASGGGGDNSSSSSDDADEVGSERQQMTNNTDTGNSTGWRLSRFEVEETPRRRRVNEFLKSNWKDLLPARIVHGRSNHDQKG